VRVLYIYCHPLPESFHASLLKEALAGLADADHEVDLLDLYAENFNPVLSAQDRRDYHDTSKNQIGLERHVERLHRADALVIQYPTWTFGLPAMLKGYFDRLLMPGVAFDITDPANVKPMLSNIRSVTGISTYGRPRWVALYVGDPPRKTITRYLPRLMHPRCKVRYHALYHMNVATLAQRQDFMARIRKEMKNLA
jgi:putative NADPH-quinone reductase